MFLSIRKLRQPEKESFSTNFSLRQVKSFGVSAKSEIVDKDPLHTAVYEQNLEKAKEILDSRTVDINKLGETYFGFTALQLAALSDQPKMVALLIEYGADLELSSGFEQGTALNCAINQSNIECAQLLINSGAKVGADDFIESVFAISYPINYAEEFENQEQAEEYLERALKVLDLITDVIAKDDQFFIQDETQAYKIYECLIEIATFMPTKDGQLLITQMASKLLDNPVAKQIIDAQQLLQVLNVTDNNYKLTLNNGEKLVIQKEAWDIQASKNELTQKSLANFVNSIDETHDYYELFVELSNATTFANDLFYNSFQTDYANQAFNRLNQGQITILPKPLINNDLGALVINPANNTLATESALFEIQNPEKLDANLIHSIYTQQMTESTLVEILDLKQIDDFNCGDLDLWVANMNTLDFPIEATCFQILHNENNAAEAKILANELAAEFKNYQTLTHLEDYLSNDPTLNGESLTQILFDQCPSLFKPSFSNEDNTVDAFELAQAEVIVKALCAKDAVTSMDNLSYIKYNWHAPKQALQDLFSKYQATELSEANPDNSDSGSLSASEVLSDLDSNIHQDIIQNNSGLNSLQNQSDFAVFTNDIAQQLPELQHAYDNC